LPKKGQPLFGLLDSIVTDFVAYGLETEAEKRYTIINKWCFYNI